MAEEVLRPVIPPSRTQQGMSQALLSPNQHSSLRMICLRKLPVSCQEPLRDIPLTSAIRMGAKCIKVMLGLCPMCDSAMARASSIRGAVSHPINSAARFDSAPTQITFPHSPGHFHPNTTCKRDVRHDRRCPCDTCGYIPGCAQTRPRICVAIQTNHASPAAGGGKIQCKTDGGAGQTHHRVDGSG